MGFSKKHHQVGISKESEPKTWVIAGIAIRAPLKPISTSVREEYDENEGGASSTTPTARDSRIPERLPCPAPQRKRRPTSTCHRDGGVREFFNPPDLESYLFAMLRELESF